MENREPAAKPLTLRVGQQSQASQTVSETGNGIDGGSKLKLESRAADLKKLLLGQRQFAVGRHLSLSPSDPDLLTVTSSAVNQAQATESSTSDTISLSPMVRQDFNNDDIDDLIAGLLPRDKSSGEPNEAAPLKAMHEVAEIPASVRSDNDGRGGATSKKTESAHLNSSPPGLPASRTIRTQPAPDSSIDRKASLPGVYETASAAGTASDASTGPNTAAKAEEPGRANDAGQMKGTATSDSASEITSQQCDKAAFSTASTHANIGVSLGADKPCERVPYINASQEAKDLQDWLLFTNYYDLAHRTQFLNRRRRLAALEVERQKLLEEEKEEAGISVQRQFTPASLQAMNSVSASVASFLGFSGAAVSHNPPALLASPLPSTLSPPHCASLLSTSPSPNYLKENRNPLDRNRIRSVTDDAIANRTANIAQYTSSAKRGREVNLAEDDNFAKRPKKAARLENANGRTAGAVGNNNEQSNSNSAGRAKQQTLDTTDVQIPNNSFDKEKTPQRQQAPLKHAGDEPRSPSLDRMRTLRRYSSPLWSGSADNRRTGTSLEENPRTNQTFDTAHYSPQFQDNDRRQRDDGRRQYQRLRSMNLGQRGGKQIHYPFNPDFNYYWGERGGEKAGGGGLALSCSPWRNAANRCHVRYTVFHAEIL